jgi:ABC-type proline/glycine betaine transport system ATPase subunit
MTSTLRLADRIAMLDGARIVAYGEVDEVLKSDAEIVKVFFDGADRVRGLGNAKQGQAKAPARVEASSQAVPEGEVPAVEIVDLHKSFGEQQGADRHQHRDAQELHHRAHRRLRQR